MNPELIRNLWLETTRRRILGLAGVLGLVFAGTAMLEHDSAQDLIDASDVVGRVVFVACGVIWASRAAGGAILDEIRGRTWDFQRLSALTPWTMTWGKLAGSGALAWIGAAVGLVAVGVASAQAKGAAQAVILVVGLAALVVFLQACAMGAALVGVRKARAEGRNATGGAVLLGVVGGVLLLCLLTGHLPNQGSSGLSGLWAEITQPTIPFWGQDMPGPLFVAVSMAAFAGWAVIGAWRLMRLELQMRNSPWVWLAFLLFVGFWRAGSARAESGAPGALEQAAVAFAALAYAASFIEPADPLRLRRFAAALGRGALAAAGDLAPSLLAPLALAVISVIAALAAPQPVFASGPSTLTCLTCLAFLVRDLGVIAVFRYSPKPGRGDLPSVLAVALLYGVGAIFDHLISGQGIALFSPLSTLSPLPTLISGVAQGAVVCVIAGQRIAGASRSATAAG